MKISEREVVEDKPTTINKKQAISIANMIFEHFMAIEEQHRISSSMPEQIANNLPHD